MTSKVIEIEGHEIELSNLDKVFFPKSGITKGELINYYDDISSLVLPLYKDRLLTMLRCPDGIQEQQFIQKKIPAYFPKWIDRHTLSAEEKSLTQALVNSKASLIYIANQGCVSFHLNLSTIDKLKYPNYLIFDLDPSSEDLKLLKSVVNRVKDFLDNLGLKSFIQTTGSHGFHIYVPLKRDLDFDKIHLFAKECASYLAKEYPDEITIEQRKEKRGKRVLIDYARNSYGLSAIAPYSLRPIENAPLATPLHWDEVGDKHLNPQTYTLKNIFKRLSKIDDPWKDMSKHQVSLKSIKLL